MPPRTVCLRGEGVIRQLNRTAESVRQAIIAYANNEAPDDIRYPVRGETTALCKRLEGFLDAVGDDE